MAYCILIGLRNAKQLSLLIFRLRFRGALYRPKDIFLSLLFITVFKRVLRKLLESKLFSKLIFFR
jgi:hypothetical protein